MKPALRWLRIGAIVLVVLIGAILVVGSWIVPSILANRLRAQFHGPAHFDNWWLGGQSAGVSGLILREGPGDNSESWLSAERVETDLSIGRVFTGRFTPSRIIIENSRLTLRVDRRGALLTKGPFGGGSSSASALPEIEIKNAVVTIEQEGRPEMVVKGVSGKLNRSGDEERLRLSSDDPTWGRWTVEGSFERDFKSGTVRLESGPKFEASPELTARVPFVPSEVWANVSPNGPIDVTVIIEVAKSVAKPVTIRTDVTFRETKTFLPSLQIVADRTSGKIAVEDGLVTLDALHGQSLGGTIAASGTLDFRGGPPRFDVTLALGKIDVASAPESWQLAEVGATGKLTGKAQLKVNLAPSGTDFTGSTGNAVIDGASVKGIPIKSLHFDMTAEGEDLQFETKPDVRSSTTPRVLEGLLMAAMTAFQTPVDPAKPADPARPKFRLPKTIKTQIELEDVELTTLVSRLELLTKIKIPVPIAGKLSIKADATIPLTALSDLKDYVFRGTATLKGASIEGVDLGFLSGEVDFDKGVLEVKNLQGRLIERPGGDASSPPPATPPPPPDTLLPPGAFRGRLRAELSPPGRLNSHFDGDDLPVCELAAPFFPSPTPVGGRLSTSFDASADLATIGEARSWSARGRVESRQLSYKGSLLDAVATRFTIDRGKVELLDLAAALSGNPLKAKIAIEMDGPRAFSADLDVSGWSIERVLALIPGAPSPAPASGIVDGHVSVVGTINPRKLTTDGKLRVRDANVESLPLGDVVATWATEGDDIHVKELAARPFSGRLSGEATIPVRPGRPAKIKIDFTSVDTDQLSKSLSGGALKMTGIANGHLRATIPPGFKGLDIDLKLDAPALTVQGVPAGTVSVTMKDVGDVLHYEATADGRDGKVRFKGDLPLSGPPNDRAANAELRAAGFTLAEVWTLLEVKGAPPTLTGRAAIDANLRVRQAGAIAVGIHGFLEVRDLHWGSHYPLGNLRGVLARTPVAWRIDTIRGDLFGGVAGGVVWGDTAVTGANAVNFELVADRASLGKAFGFLPHLERRLEGLGSIRLHGRMDSALRATADITVPHGRIAGIAISEVRIPGEISFVPVGGNGHVQARRFSARIAGGRVVGNASARVGEDRSFTTDLTLTDVDVETIARAESTASKPGSGKINGRIILSGPDPASPPHYRGRIDLNLRDAALGDIPVIRELSRFLGSAQGGAFEAGELHATIANRQVLVDQLTLAGRVLQIHATGGVTFDGSLDLAVLVNTSQIIPETGQALLGIIPGLRGAAGRSEEAVRRVSSYFSNRLLKFRIGGTIKNPSVSLDPAIVVGEAATGFFAGVLKLPLGFLR